MQFMILRPEHVRLVSAQLWSHLTTFFGILLRVLRRSDNVSKTLQSLSLSATDSHACAKLTLSTLHRIQNHDSINLFWAIVLQHQSRLDVLPPKLPKKGRAAARFSEGAEPFHRTTTEAAYHQEFLQQCSCSRPSNCTEQRFNASRIEISGNAWKGIAECSRWEAPWWEDAVDRTRLETQMEMLGTAMDSSPLPNLRDVKNYLCSLSPDQLFKACTLLNLIVASPAPNSVSERSASALQSAKSYLRSTMPQERLNYSRPSLIRTPAANDD